MTNTPEANPAQQHVVSKAKHKTLKRKLRNKRRKLRRVKENLAALKSQLNCSICFELLIDPFITGCGHSYCYTCIAEWFAGITKDAGDDDSDAACTSRSTKCPVCRQTITQRPIRNIIASQLVDTVVGQMRDGRTEKEALIRRKEFSRESLARDTLNGQLALWEGMFSTGEALLDQSDGVKRCAGCLWEIVNGQCINCGITFDREGGDGGAEEDDGSEEEEDVNEGEDYLGTDEDFSDEAGSAVTDFSDNSGETSNESTGSESSEPSILPQTPSRKRRSEHERQQPEQTGKTPTKRRRLAAAIIESDTE